MFTIDLPFLNDWSSVGLLRASVEQCCQAMFSDCEGRHTLAMVTGELMENAIKYGDWSGPGRSFRLRVWGEGDHAYVCVENPVRPGDHNADEVLRTLRWVAGFPSVRKAYEAKLLEIAARGDAADASGLGLVRVAYEGRCHLTAEREGDLLRITGALRLDGLPPEGSPPDSWSIDEPA